MNLGEDVTDFVEDVYAKRKQASKHQKAWRDEARECYEFRDGDQWDSTDRAIMEEQNRPIVTFNRVGPIIDSIIGNEIGNRQEIRYFPRGLTDSQPNEAYTEGARWGRDMCDAEDEESDAYSDALTCGMGFMELSVDYDTDPQGQIIQERVPPLEMRWDPKARKHNLADSNWFIREKYMPLRDIEARWPGAKDLHPPEDSLGDAEWLDEHDASSAWKYEQDQSWYDPKEDLYLVIHYQWREREPYYLVGDPESGRTIEFDERRFGRIRSRIEEMGVPFVKLNKWHYQQAFIAGPEELEKGDAPTNGFSFHCITAKREEKTGLWFGLMRCMKDPQKWANKFFSSAMYIFQSNAKGGLIVEDGAVDDKRRFEDGWTDPSGITYVNDGAITGGMIQQKSLGGYPSSLDKLLSFAVSSIRDVSGINLELLGMADREQAGVLEIERKKAALVILSPLMNSLRRYRKMSGRTLLAFMRKYIPEGTIVRVTDHPVPFYRDDDVIKYDVVVDTAPNSPNLKHEVWQGMQNVLPALIKSGVPIDPKLLKFSPLPESISQEMIQYVEERSGISPDTAQQLQEAMKKIQDLEGENRKLQDKRDLAQAETQRRMQTAVLEAQLEQEKMLQERQRWETELAWKSKISDADRAAKLLEINSRHEIEMAKLREGGQLEKEIAAAKIESDREIKVVSLEAKREEKRLEHQQTMNEDISPVLETEVVQKVGRDIDAAQESILDRLERLASDAERRRTLVLDYVAQEGGDLAQLADKLR